MLERANSDWRLQYGIEDDTAVVVADLGAFAYWLKQQWGLEIEIVGGNIGAARNVRNEAKYTMFLLKYGSA